MLVMSTSFDSVESIIDAAVRALKVGELIVYPTDTLYGFGADATSDEAVARLREAKKLPADKPISVAVSDFSMLRRYAAMDAKQLDVARELLPGQFTLILRAKPGISTELSNTGTVGFRIPADQIAVRIVEKLGKPITATSANTTTKPTAFSVDEIISDLGEKAALYISAGERNSDSSTVIDLSGAPKLVRKGAGVQEAISIVSRFYGKL